jgi:hypothetical protein
LAETVADPLEFRLVDVGDRVDRVELGLEVAGRADRALEREPNRADRPADAEGDGGRRLRQALARLVEDTRGLGRLLLEPAERLLRLADAGRELVGERQLRPRAGARSARPT